MKTIYKFPLGHYDNQKIQIHGNPFQFHVGLDPSGILCVWALVDTSLPLQPHRFFVVGTGHQIPKDASTWIGSVTQIPCVWHVFKT